MAALRASSRRIGEPVVVSSKQNGLFPKAFVWRGRRHDDGRQRRHLDDGDGGLLRAPRR